MIFPTVQKVAKLLGVMGWKGRLRELVLAGGAFGLGACMSTEARPGIPCGNVNPDPCICGRPSSDPVLRMQCDQKHACEANGGVWDPFYTTSVEGVTIDPHCEMTDAADSVDGTADGGDPGDGSMNAGK